MRSVHDEVLNLRLPRDLRADLDGAALADGSRVSVVARRALAAGLRAIRSSVSNDDDPPHPGGAPAGVPHLPAAA